MNFQSLSKQMILLKWTASIIVRLILGMLGKIGYARGVIFARRLQAQLQVLFKMGGLNVFHKNGLGSYFFLDPDLLN